MPSRLEEFVARRERKARKLADLVALLQDPELADDVADLLQERQQSITPPIARRPIAEPSSNGNGNHSALPPGITAALTAIGPALPDPFTIREAAEALTAGGYIFARDSINTVRDALYWATRADEPRFRVVEAGRGGRASTYQYIAEGN
jgi:hypothetical protein